MAVALVEVMRSAMVMAVVMAVGMAGAGVSAAATDPSLCEPPTTLIVLDRSSSMLGADAEGHSKWESARWAIDRMLLEHGNVLAFGLMTFPYPDACGPGRLDVPPSPGQRGAIGEALRVPPPPSGAWTPLGETLMVAADPTQLGGYQPDNVLVITDGFQWCSPFDPAQRDLPLQAVELLRARGARTFAVGFGEMADEETLAAMAVLGGTAPAGCDPTGEDLGRPCFYQADDGDALAAVLTEIAARTSVEICDGRDNDCNGEVDDGATCHAGSQCLDGACVAVPDGEVPALPEDGDPAGGCGCGASGSPGGLALAVAVSLGLYRRRRRGNASAPSASSASPDVEAPLP